MSEISRAITLLTIVQRCANPQPCRLCVHQIGLVIGILQAAAGPKVPA